MTAPGPLTVSRLRHDLRTYVNHLQGYGEMILETVQDDGPAPLAADSNPPPLVGASHWAPPRPPGAHAEGVDR